MRAGSRCVSLRRKWVVAGHAPKNLSNRSDTVGPIHFKSHLESLPAHERRVYLALAGLWKPATAREVAEQARMETSACSAQLRRLMGRGVVSDAGGTNRRKQYYVSERLYNIYYLLRRSRGTDSLVQALVRFMDAYYSAAELLLNRLDRHDERVLAGGVADHDAETALTVRLTTHAIRAIARIEDGSLADATADVREILGTIPRLSAIPVGTIQTLIAVSIALGVDRMASLIRESPSAGHLLPLTTALDWEMGKKPRVAAEVRKVAEDIQHEFVEAREQLSNNGRTRVEVN